MGFVALTGEVGAGKTTLLKYLLEQVDRSFDVAMIFNTLVDPHGLLQMVAKEYGVTVASNQKSDLVDALYKHFVRQYSAGNRCVVVIDEAQNLADDSFEELRMLSNLDTGSDFILQIILVGQPQLRARLAHQSLAQLTQRISVHYHLSSLLPDEIDNYVQHRLKVAGYDRPEPLFEEGAAVSVAHASRGIPRIINTICDASLTYAFADRMDRVTTAIVEKVIEDNQLLRATVSGHGGELESKVHVQPIQPEKAPWDGSAASQPLLTHICSRLELLELRVRSLDSADRDRTVDVLQEMLARERETTLELAQKIASVVQKYRKLQEHVAALKNRGQMAALKSSRSPQSKGPGILKNN